jgi:hypothetical protein
MKKIVRFALLLGFIFTPTLSRAATVCATDQYGDFYVFDIKPACTPSSTKKVSTITGRWHLGLSGPSCQGKRTWGIHGTCLGSLASNEIRLNLTSELVPTGSDPTNCLPTFWSLRGNTPNAATGRATNLSFLSNIQLSPANCALEPAVD